MIVYVVGVAAPVYMLATWLLWLWVQAASCLLFVVVTTAAVVVVVVVVVVVINLE